MNVVLFAFSKKKNSTARPVVTDGTSFTVELKEETSVMSPVLIFDPSNLPQPFSPAAYNYALIANWSRYYFITDWRWLNGRWEASLISDVLATYRTSIGAMSEYVVRSSAASDGTIVDGRYPIKSSGSMSVVTLGNLFNINTGCYVVGVVNCMTSGNRIGAVSYYAMTETQLNSLLQYLYSDNIYNNSGVSSIEAGLYKAIANPIQYIVSCMWVPVAAETIGSDVISNVICGYFQTTAGGRVCLAQNVAVGSTIKQLPNHPQSSRGAYMNYSPFSRYTLFYPPFGVIPIESTVRTKGSYLHMHCLLDYITGQAVLRLSVQNSSSAVPVGDRYLFNERTAQVGIPIQLSQVQTDIVNGVGGLVQSAISGLTGDYIGAASGVLGAVGDLYNNRSVSIGYNGSFLETWDINVASIICEFYNQADRDVTHEGSPLMAVRTLSSIPGYIQCADGHYDGACMDEERTEINNYLLGGFYYE